MTWDSLEMALRAFYKRRPFQPFTLELASGSRIEVNHPEVLRRHRDTDLLLYRSTSGLHSIFDCGSVVRLIGGTGIH